MQSSVLGIAILVPGSPSFGLGVSIVHPTGAADERQTVLAALRAAAKHRLRGRRAELGRMPA